MAGLEDKKPELECKLENMIEYDLIHLLQVFLI